MSEHKGNWLIDLDGTLAHYDGWKGPLVIGEPVMPMLDRVKKMLGEGKDVRIFTARVFPLTAAEDVNAWPANELLLSMSERDISAWQAVAAIRVWCEKHLGRVLPITCRKDFATVEIWDDRAIGVFLNRGIDRETMVAMHLHRVLMVARVIVTEGDGFAEGADRGCAKIAKLFKAVEDVRALVDGAADAAEYAAKVAGINPDLNRARANIQKANEILKAIN